MASTSSTKIVAEYAKSGKSSCKKCSEKIDSKSLRLGLKIRDPRGYDSIKWHHFNCFSSMDSISVSSDETIQGFTELMGSDQDKLKKMVSEGNQSSRKREGDDETESDRKDLKKLKTDEDEEAGKEKKKVTKEKIIAEYAKSGKSSCRKCSEKIESKSLRLGLSSWDPRGFENTKWHHLDCFFPLNTDLVSLESIEGFLELKSSDQEKLKKLVIEGGQSFKKSNEDGQTELQRQDQKSKKTNEDEEAGKEKKKATKEKIVAEYAKSGKSSCRKCLEKIESKSLRLGLSCWDPRGFENTKWHHLDCFFPLNTDLVSLESIEGFLVLKSSDQEKLKKLVIEGGQSFKKSNEDGQTELQRQDQKSKMTNEDEEAGKEKKATKEKIVAEYAKSGKSSCRKCSEKIKSKSLRLGLSCWDPRGFENTKWHHLECFFPLNTDLVSLESIEGFLVLKSSDQEKLKKLVIEGGQSFKKPGMWRIMEQQFSSGIPIDMDQYCLFLS